MITFICPITFEPLEMGVGGGGVLCMKIVAIKAQSVHFKPIFNI